MRSVSYFGVVCVAALTLAACNGKPSAVATQGASAPTAYGSASTGAAPSDARGSYGGSYASADPRDAPVPQVDGKPMWAANRKHSAEDNAQYQFAKNGGDFGAANETDYVKKAHDFVERPPHGADTIERSNGDKLIYDPSGNVFAVVSRDGAPRTMFKPRDGASYWAQQKDRESKRGKSGYSGGSQSSDQS
jgi:pyocin large subunit-like protein